MNKPHVIIMAGGTGGHIYPALAVAEELKKQGVAVSWLGTRKGLEAQLVPNAGIEIDYIDIEGVRGKGWKSLLKAPILLTGAISQARRIIKQRRAQVVVGFGGFVAGPGGVAAKLCGLPLIVHEQNAIAGTTNKLLAKIANHVFSAFPSVFKGALVVGNPVRKEIVNLPNPSDRWQPTTAEAGSSGNQPFKLLVLGGSLGAAALNALVPQAIAAIRARQDINLRVLHQCGKKNIEATQRAYQQSGLNFDDEFIQVKPYVEDMASAYAEAHFVICRAGALTVSEIAAAGCASLMVPYPYAIDDHQTHNAMWLVDQGAARVCQQKDLSLERLVDELLFAVNQRENVLTMANKARDLAQVDAAEKVAEKCVEVMSSGH